LVAVALVAMTAGFASDAVSNVFFRLGGYGQGMPAVRIDESLYVLRVGVRSDTISPVAGRVVVEPVWRDLNGTLPPGLALDPATGEISGTPLLQGSYDVILALADKAGLSYGSTEVFTIEVLPALATNHDNSHYMIRQGVAHQTTPPPGSGT